MVSTSIKVNRGPDIWALVTGFFRKAGWMEDKPTINFSVDPCRHKKSVINAEIRAMRKLEPQESVDLRRQYDESYGYDIELTLKLFDRCAHCHGSSITVVYSTLYKEGVVIAQRE